MNLLAQSSFSKFSPDNFFYVDDTSTKAEDCFKQIHVYYLCKLQTYHNLTTSSNVEIWVS